MRKSLFLLFSLLVAVPLMATTVMFVSNEESVKLSEHILMGRVEKVEASYDREGQIVRQITMSVHESLKGNVRAGSLFTFQAWGGTKDGVKDQAIGEASYKKGERILVQLERIGDAYHTLGLSFGKWNVEKDTKGKDFLRRDLSGLTGVGKAPVPVKMELQQMRDLVRRVEEDRAVK